MSEPARDVAYWRSRPVSERAAELERLRRERHGPGDDRVGMERVARLIDGKTGEVLREWRAEDPS